MPLTPSLADQGAVVLGFQGAQAHGTRLVLEHQDGPVAGGRDENCHMARQRILEADLAWVIQSSGCVDDQRPRVERLLHRWNVGVTSVTPDRRHRGRAIGGGPTKLGYDIALQLTNMQREGCVPDQVVRLHMVLVDDRPLAPAGAGPQVQHSAAE